MSSGPPACGAWTLACCCCCRACGGGGVHGPARDPVPGSPCSRAHDGPHPPDPASVLWSRPHPSQAGGDVRSWRVPESLARHRAPPCSEAARHAPLKAVPFLGDAAVCARTPSFWPSPCAGAALSPGCKGSFLSCLGPSCGPDTLAVSWNPPSPWEWELLQRNVHNASIPVWFSPCTPMCMGARGPPLFRLQCVPFPRKVTPFAVGSGSRAPRRGARCASHLLTGCSPFPRRSHLCS